MRNVEELELMNTTDRDALFHGIFPEQSLLLAEYPYQHWL